jgi:hypothetical protein
MDLIRTIVTATACLLVAGCCGKCKCAGAVAEIFVRDQAGALPSGTKVQRGDGTDSARYCQNRDAACCAFWVTREGVATVSAPGYKPVSVKVERKLDDCGNDLPQPIEVVLVPETSAVEPVVVVGSALGCS